MASTMQAADLHILCCASGSRVLLWCANRWIAKRLCLGRFIRVGARRWAASPGLELL